MVVGEREVQERGNICIHVGVWQKPTPHCKAIILRSQFFFNFKNSINFSACAKKKKKTSCSLEDFLPVVYLGKSITLRAAYGLSVGRLLPPCPWESLLTTPELLSSMCSCRCHCDLHGGVRRTATLPGTPPSPKWAKAETRGCVHLKGILTQGTTLQAQVSKILSMERK